MMMMWEAHAFLERLVIIANLSQCTGCPKTKWHQILRNTKIRVENILKH